MLPNAASDSSERAQIHPNCWFTVGQKKTQGRIKKNNVRFKNLCLFSFALFARVFVLLSMSICQCHIVVESFPTVSGLQQLHKLRRSEQSVLSQFILPQMPQMPQASIHCRNVSCRPSLQQAPSTSEGKCHQALKPSLGIHE